MRMKGNINEKGNVILCVLGSILILSLIGATVLHSSVTRLNASTSHVRAWKEALSAAETGGDIAFAQISTLLGCNDPNPDNCWSGWTPGTNSSGTRIYTKTIPNFANNLHAQTVAEPFYFDNSQNFQPGPGSSLSKTWYRVRSKGTASLPGLKRAGMDDLVVTDASQHFAAFGSGPNVMLDITARGKGDSLLRKIDFNTDHFVATYGPNGDRTNLALVAPTVAPSISRRIEQIVTPVKPFFDAAIKTATSFYGLGSASFIDSYNSNNGLYDINVKTTPSSPYYGDSRHGNVEVNSATATVKGSIYGDVGTNGGNVTQGNPGTVYGTIDNNVPFNSDPVPRVPSSLVPQPSPTSITSANQTITPPAAGSDIAPTYYLLSAITKQLTLNPVNATTDTYIVLHVTGDINSNSAGITVNPRVHVKIYFDGNINCKAQNLVNTSPNTPDYPGSGPFCGNLQFYGTGSGAQTVDLDSGGGQPQIFATFYAPNANVNMGGAPDFYGTVVANSFFANGNITWHYDRALNDSGIPQGFKIVSYVEDTR